MSKLPDYEIRLDKLNTANSNKIDTEIKENEEKLSTEFDKNIDDIKDATYRSTNNTLHHPNSHNSRYSSNQTSADITKCPLLKSPDFHSHASKFIKHLSHMTLDSNTIIQLQKRWDAIRSAL